MEVCFSVLSLLGLRVGCGAVTFKMLSACFREQRNSCIYVKALKFIIYLQGNWSTQQPKKLGFHSLLFLYVKVMAVFVCHITRRQVLVLLHNRLNSVEEQSTINLVYCHVISPAVRKRQQEKGGTGTDTVGDKNSTLLAYI